MRALRTVAALLASTVMEACLPWDDATPAEGWRAMLDEESPSLVHFYLTGRPLESDYIFVTLTQGRQWSAHLPTTLSDMPALAVLAMATGAEDSIDFTLEREPGSLRFTGVISGGEARGAYTLTPHDDFTGAFVALGYDEPSRGDLIVLALMDVHLDDLRGFAERGYGPLDRFMLRGWAESGAGPELLDSLALAGYGNLPPAEALALVGIPTSLLDALRAVGLGDRLPSVVRQMVMADGVTEAQVRGFIDPPFARPSANDLESLLSGGVTAELLQAAAGLGVTGVASIVGMRRQGFDAQYIAELRAVLPDSLTLDRAVVARRLRLLRRLTLGPTDLWVFERSPAGGPLLARRLTDDAATYDWPRVSPDGRRVVYAELSPRPRLLTLGLDALAPPFSVLEGVEAWMPAWSPDGSEIVFGSDDRIRVVASTGGAVRTFDYSGWQGWIAWAPAREIVYGRDNLRWYSVLDPATEDERPLPYRPGPVTEGWAYPSPDGTQLALAVGVEPHLAVAQIRGGGGSRLLEGEWSPIGWTPDGASVLAMDLREGGGTEVWRVDVSDRERTLHATLPVPVTAEQITAAPDGETFVAVLPR